MTAVYELVIRTHSGRTEATAQANQLHKQASSLVNAGAQSAMTGAHQGAESDRGRTGRSTSGAATHNSATMAKHATMADYRRATGFEALMGYLYLTGGIIAGLWSW